MKTYTQEELNEILYTHNKWLYNSSQGQRADLRGADLRGADLQDADLIGTIGNRREIKTIQTDIWSVVYTANRMAIGCECHDIAEWWEFSDERVNRMDGRALEFWKKWKPVLQEIIRISPAMGTHGDVK